MGKQMIKGKKKILLVEDDKPLRELYEINLKDKGYQVISVSNGQDALAKAVDTKPDLIILDIMLPEIDGFSVLDILKTTPKTKNIPVAILTVLSESETKQKCQAYGIEDFFVKSESTISQILKRIKEILKEKSY
jgi:two-component system alkaline phosphatase synthesis response regulator PhoP